MSEFAPTTKPYLLRAIYEWCVDSGFTPYISVVVDANTRVPMEYVRNGEIVLNIGPLAANKLQLGNEFIEMQARFGGAPRELSIPLAAVAAIYAKENGHGMSFDSDKDEAAPWEPGGSGLTEVGSGSNGDDPPNPPRPIGRPTLRRIK
jgi:stringent starvation protein B